MSTKTILIAAVSALTTLFGAASLASAHGSGHSMHSMGGMGSMPHMMHDHRFFRHSPRFLIVGPSYGCGYYYSMWMETGSWYWKRKYFYCKGW